MTDRSDSKPSTASVERWIRDGEHFVLLPEAEYRRLRDIADDASDLRDLEAARRANRGKRGITLSQLEKRLRVAKPQRTVKQPRRKSA